jgi:putative membrane protein
MKKIFLEEFFIFLRGLLMGAADIVPGVSGGTIALITGIYQRFIDGIHGVLNKYNSVM